MNEIIINGVTYIKKEKAQQKTEEKVVGIAIKNRFTGDIIFQSTKTTYRDAIIEMGTDANLTDADLTGADLTGADLTGVNLTGVNFTGADLTGADLTGADLTRADLTACYFYMGSMNKNFEALCKAIKTIKWNSNTGADFIGN